MNDKNKLKSILLLFANPKETTGLRLQEEEREIKKRLRLAGYGKIPINSAVAIRPTDIQQAIVDFSPQIVHFSGHGAGQNGLVLEDRDGQEKLVSSNALANLFKIFSERVKCLILNACFSTFQAEAIVQYIDYVIGMDESIGDEAAIEFSVGFYTGLGAGESIETSYKLGCNAIDLAGIPEHLTPVLFRKDEEHDIDKFTKLAQQLWKLLAENKRAFVSFNPNSGAESAAPVKWDLDLWESAKKEIIAPNNKKIQRLINKNYDLIPQEYKAVFDQMNSHIYAFEKHISNPTLDYSGNQFPISFFEIIDRICVQEVEDDDKVINEITEWLLEKFKQVNLPIIDIYLIGSILRNVFNGSDVDVFLLLGDKTPVEVKDSVQKVNIIKESFLLELGRPLHTIVFSEPETAQFYEFLGRLERIKKFI